jgi:hypothetical protein
MATTGPASQFMMISKPIPAHIRALMSTGRASHARARAWQATNQDSATKIQASGLKVCDFSGRASLNMSSSKTPQDYSIAEWMESFGRFPKAGMMQNGRVSALAPLAVPSVEKGSLSLPTLTTGLGSYRNVGQTLCEARCRRLNLFPDTQVLSVEMMALMFSFPSDWTACLSDAIVKPPSDSSRANSLGEPSMLIAQRSRLEESSILSNVLGGRNSNCIEENLHDRLAQLEIRRDEIRCHGAIAPKGCWIESGVVAKRKFKQVYWRSDSPIFEGKKRKYIGEFDSPEHKLAGEAIARRNELAKVSKQIIKLEEFIENADR